MLNRREFLQAAGIGALASSTQMANAEEPTIDINDTLTNIACVLSASEHVESVDMHLVDKPTTGLTQWRWFHFNETLTMQEFEKLEKVNVRLLETMKDIFDRGDMGLDHLMLEGLVEGNMRDQVQRMRNVQYDMIAKLIRVTHPSSGRTFNTHPDVIARKIDDENHLRRRAWLKLEDRRYTYISPLGRLGAGYVLATQRNVLFDAAEDPEIDRQAEIALNSRNQKEFDEWVMRKRNEHFVKLVRENRRRLNHLLVGANHDLREEIGASNATHDEKISHIVVSVKGLSQE